MLRKGFLSRSFLRVYIDPCKGTIFKLAVLDLRIHKILGRVIQQSPISVRILGTSEYSQNMVSLLVPYSLSFECIFTTWLNHAACMLRSAPDWSSVKLLTDSHISAPEVLQKSYQICCPKFSNFHVHYWRWRFMNVQLWKGWTAAESATLAHWWTMAVLVLTYCASFMAALQTSRWNQVRN